MRLELLEALAHIDEILPVYRRMAEVLDDDPQVLSEYAWYLSELGQELDVAESAARRAIELDPEYADAFDTLARILYLQGHLGEAVEAVERAIELDAGNALYRERRLEYVQAFRRELSQKN
jgi:tetratricopeptide (TPR) repeat protein